MEPVGYSPASPDPEPESPGASPPTIIGGDRTWEESGSESADLCPATQGIRCRHCMRIFPSRYDLGKHYIDDINPLELPVRKRKTSRKAFWDLDEKIEPCLFGFREVKLPEEDQIAFLRNLCSREDLDYNAWSGILTTDKDKAQRTERLEGQPGRKKHRWLTGKPSAAAGSPADLETPSPNEATIDGGGPQKPEFSAVRAPPYCAPAGRREGATPETRRVPPLAIMRPSILPLAIKRPNNLPLAIMRPNILPLAIKRPNILRRPPASKPLGSGGDSGETGRPSGLGPSGRL